MASFIGGCDFVNNHRKALVVCKTRSRRANSIINIVLSGLLCSLQYRKSFNRPREECLKQRISRKILRIYVLIVGSFRGAAALICAVFIVGTKVVNNA